MSVRMRDGRPIIEIYDPATRAKRHVKRAEILALGLKVPTNERQARRVEVRLLEAQERALSGSDTCEGFAQRWTIDYPRPDESSNRTNAERVRKFGQDFGGRPLASISRREARAWANENPGRIPAVRAMFNDALEDEIVTANPFAKLRMVREESPRERGKKRSPVTQAELDRLADTALTVHKDNEAFALTVRALILVAAYTGLRAGELFGLRWSDIHGDTLTVSRQFSSRLGREKAPKKGSTGTVFIPAEAREALATVPRRLGDDLVFRTKRGRQFSQGNLQTAWGPVRDTFGRHDLVFHTLRHFCATHLLNELRVEPWKVAKQLRHSDGGTLVLDTYGHPDEQVALEDIRRAYGENTRQLRPVSGDSEGTALGGSAS